MNPVSRTMIVRLKIVLARWEQRVGWPGLLGVSLLVTGATLLAVGRPDPLARQSVDSPLDTLDAARGEPPVAPAPPLPPVPTIGDLPVLPPIADVPLLLTRIQRAALDQGLGWP